MITKQTAFDLWIAYDEIDKGEKLLKDMEEVIKRGEVPDLRDHWGNRHSLQLGIPSGDNAHRLLDVAPALAVEVVKAHIAQKRAALGVINARAAIEAGEERT